MTLRQLLDKVRLSDLHRELRISLNGEEAVPVRAVQRNSDPDTGELVQLVLTNEEDPLPLTGSDNNDPDADPDAGDGEDDENGDGEEEQ